MDITIKKEYFKESPYAEYSDDLTLNALGIFDIIAIPGGGTLLKFNFGLEEVELKTDLIVTITMLANLIQDANMSFEKVEKTQKDNKKEDVSVKGKDTFIKIPATDPASYKLNKHKPAETEKVKKSRRGRRKKSEILAEATSKKPSITNSNSTKEDSLDF